MVNKERVEENKEDRQPKLYCDFELSVRHQRQTAKL